LGDAAQVAPLDKLSVVLVAIFAVIFLGEKLAMREIIGIALIAFGAFLVATGRSYSQSLTNKEGDYGH
jgi:transporter family protein